MLEKLEILNETAKKIQRCWKRYRIFTLIPKTLKFRRNKANITIQKHMRGYKNFVKFREILRNKRLNSNFKYFTKMREKLELDTVVKLQYNVRKFIKK